MRSTFFANSPEVQAAELPWVDRGKHDNNECPLAWLSIAVGNGGAHGALGCTLGPVPRNWGPRSWGHSAANCGTSISV